jgi:hypothetical protein
MRSMIAGPLGSGRQGFAWLLTARPRAGLTPAVPGPSLVLPLGIAFRVAIDIFGPRNVTNVKLFVCCHRFRTHPFS